MPKSTASVQKSRARTRSLKRGWRRLIPRDSIAARTCRLSSRSTGKKWKPSAITKVASRTFTPTRAVGAMAQPRLRASSRGEVVRTRCAEATITPPSLSSASAAAETPSIVMDSGSIPGRSGAPPVNIVRTTRVKSSRKRKGLNDPTAALGPVPDARCSIAIATSPQPTRTQDEADSATPETTRVARRRARGSQRNHGLEPVRVRVDPSADRSAVMAGFYSGRGQVTTNLRRHLDPVARNGENEDVRRE